MSEKYSGSSSDKITATPFHDGDRLDTHSSALGTVKVGLARADVVRAIHPERKQISFAPEEALRLKYGTIGDMGLRLAGWRFELASEPIIDQSDLSTSAN